MAGDGSGNFRLAALVVVLYVLLLGTGCAYMQEIQEDTGQPRFISWLYPVLEIAEDMLPAPWNWIAGGVTSLLLGGTAVGTGLKLKNSPEGKLFGPMQKGA